MRVVAGTARGRRLVVPAGDAVRPTSDRVREAVFNALGSLGAVQDAEVLDLFAGTGALGIEALSRGAAHATFVERDATARRAVEENLRLTGLGERATVLGADALAHLDTAGDHGVSTAGIGLALVDPPYSFDRWPELLGRLAVRHPAVLVVAESDRDVAPPPGGELVRRRRYGGTVVSIMTLTEEPM
jgi:16S rRNA (guanine966-N2)-methyltransferase